MKKLIAVILVATMLACMIPTLIVGVSAETLSPDTTWYTDENYIANGNKYLLEDAEDVLGFSNLLAGIGVSAPVNFDGKNVELTADVDLKNNTWGLLEGALEDDATRPESRDPWAFSVLQNYGFWGNFDGKGHTISGIKFDGYESDAKDAHDCCLFGIVPKGKSATVKNLAIDNSLIEVSYFSGAIFSTIEGTATVENVYIGKKVTVQACGQSIGMLIGRVMSTGELTVKNCVLEGSFIDSWTKDRLHAAFVASIAGKVTIENSAMYGNMQKTGGSNFQTSAHASIVQKFEKDPSNTDANYAPSLTLKNVIVCALIADTYADGQSTNKVTYLMKEPAEGVTLNMENVFYVQVGNPIVGVEGVKIEKSAITGSAASTFLSEKGLSDWEATEKYPVPASIKEIIYPSANEEVTTEAPVVETTPAEVEVTTPAEVEQTTPEEVEQTTPSVDGDTTTAPVKNEQGGCGGIAIIAQLVALVCAATAVVVIKKK